MTRTVLNELLLFLIPFAAFALYLAVRRRNPFTRAPWQGHVPWLVIVGLVLAIGFFIVTWFLEPRSTGEFVPPHMENGRLVPGQFR